MATQEEQNLELFDRVDFEAWNGPDWDLFRQLHTEDVFVDMSGQQTEGIDAHVDMCRQIREENPGMTVQDHPIKMAQGEWTCVIGDIAGGQRMFTVARWRDGAISEEYIMFIRS